MVIRSQAHPGGTKILWLLIDDNLTDNPVLTRASEPFFLDIRTTLPILKALFLHQPLTSILEVPNGETCQKVQALLPTGR